MRVCESAIMSMKKLWETPIYSFQWQKQMFCRKIVSDILILKILRGGIRFYLSDEFAQVNLTKIFIRLPQKIINKNVYSGNSTKFRNISWLKVNKQHNYRDINIFINSLPKIISSIHKNLDHKNHQIQFHEWGFLVE